MRSNVDETEQGLNRAWSDRTFNDVNYDYDKIYSCVERAISKRIQLCSKLYMRPDPPLRARRWDAPLRVSPSPADMQRTVAGMMRVANEAISALVEAGGRSWRYLWQIKP